MTTNQTKKYRFEYRIFEEDTDETVTSGSTYVSSVHGGSCESVEMEVGSAIRYLEKHDN